MKTVPTTRVKETGPVSSRRKMLKKMTHLVTLVILVTVLRKRMEVEMQRRAMPGQMTIGVP